MGRVVNTKADIDRTIVLRGSLASFPVLLPVTISTVRFLAPFLDNNYKYTPVSFAVTASPE